MESSRKVPHESDTASIKHLFIPELDMTFIRQPDTPVPDMRVQIMDVVSDEPQGHEQLHEPDAAFEELSETPGRENGNEPEK